MAKVSLAWERTLSTKGSTRGTGYSMSNKIITHNGVVTAGWLDTFGINQAQAFSSDGTPTTDIITVGEGQDNHCGHALTIDRDEHLHWIVGRHHARPFEHKVSRETNDIRWWTEAEPTGGSSPTYPSLVCDRDNTLHLVCRQSYPVKNAPKGYNPSFTLSYQRKIEGQEWTDPVNLVIADTSYGYTHLGASLAVDYNGTIHLGFHIYEDVRDKKGHTAGYLKSVDGGDTWTRADGTEMHLPADRDTADILESADNVDIRVSNIAADSKGNPALVAMHRESGDDILLEHNGSEWHSTLLLETLQKSMPDRCFSMDGSISFDSSDNLYIAVQTVEDPEQWGDAPSEVVLLFREAGNKDFQVLPISQPDSSTPNWLPNLERKVSVFQNVGIPHLIYTHGTKGVGCESEDYNDIRLVGLKLS